MKYYALIDTHVRGEDRFTIKHIDYSPSDSLDLNVICIDKSLKNVKESKELLLNDWERDKVAENSFTPSKGPFLCVTGHSKGGLITHFEPWYQVKKEVLRRGYEFID